MEWLLLPGKSFSIACHVQTVVDRVGRKKMNVF
jgi:hypothetical protein